MLFRSEERFKGRDRDGGGKGERDGPRHGRDGDRRRGGERAPQQFKASPPPKGRGPDPNSPFAALSALKAALEKGDKGS